MNLVIDQGNTAVKIAQFINDEISTLKIFNKEDVEDMMEYVQQIQFSVAIYSSVGGDIFSIQNIISKKADCFIKLSHATPLPITIEYSTPQTLGVDRIAGAVGAWCVNKGKTSLVIDAGTAITYDIVTAEGIYKGGNISPGISMRFKALNHYTNSLPLVTLSEVYSLVGRDTESAILSGVMNGVMSEVEGYIDKISKKERNISVILTGGDHSVLHNQLKNSTFVPLIDEEYLVLKGLNTILRYNVEK
ncbi:MAG: type III pantothenate kinase [Bacteroidales bacterium]|nr:type III pantothenate kinase [Bacteroidales bacterium]MBQ7818966.1 type III pantothenate kinase [Bacteroidales bacterium]